jgi:hypothetical protein
MARRQYPTHVQAALEQAEAEFQDSLLKLLKLNGWPEELIYHTFDSRRSRAGFPDIVAVKPSDGRLLIAELKKDSGTLSPEQRGWIEALQAVRYFDVRVWRPRDMDEIVKLVR